MIVAEKVQQAVQREHPQFGRFRVARLARLAPGHPRAITISPRKRCATEDRERFRNCRVTRDLRVLRAMLGKEHVGGRSMPRYCRLSARTRCIAHDRDADACRAARAGATAASQRDRPRAIGAPARRPRRLT